MEGIVIQYSEEKGFGFIRKDDGTNLFYHKSNVVGDLPKVNDRVTFSHIFNGKRGLQADKVEIKKS